MSSIQDAFTCKTSGPYSTLMKVKLVSHGDVQTYRGQDGEEKKSLLVAVSDGTDCIPTKIYDEGEIHQSTGWDLPGTAGCNTQKR